MSSLKEALVFTCSFLLANIAVIHSGYIVTLPRKWTAGSSMQVCVFFTNGTTPGGTLNLTMVPNDLTKVVPSFIIKLHEEKNEFCDQLVVPILLSSTLNTILEITGILGGKNISHSSPLTITTSSTRTFIQTDKFLYKPGQTVQFRILTITSPFLKISTDKYSKIWVETPSGSHITQWLNVDNQDGLIHLSFQLADEPEEGTYTIKVDTTNSGVQTRTFKVEEYVLPRFEVSVTPPKYILATDKAFNFTVCAKYTYGQPVKGNVTLVIENGYSSMKVVIKRNANIFGCKDLEFTNEEVQLNLEYNYAYSLRSKATVVEDGTGVELTAEVNVDISRTALSFKNIGKEEFSKPELPFTGMVKAEFPDGSPAVGEPFEVCLGSKCKNISTDSSGLLVYVVPPHLTGNRAQIKALNYQTVQMPKSQWRVIMYESKYQGYSKKYFSPSNSSLVIQTSIGKVFCRQDKADYIVSVLFASNKQTEANITVQVISRGQIQYWNTEKYSLAESSLPVDEQHLIEAMTPSNEGITRGVLNIKVELPPTTSPRAKVLVWYSRDDGEVVSDTQEVEIESCLLNVVNLSWSKDKVQPGEEAMLKLTAEPSSVCSLGVVDKSVELLSAENEALTLNTIFRIVANSMISEFENAQSNDYEHCQKNIEEINKDPLPLPVPVPLEPVTLPAVFNQDNVSEPNSNTPSEELERKKRSWWWPFYSNYVDALKMFDKSGLFVFTDLTVETRPCERQEQLVYSPGSFKFKNKGNASFGIAEEMSVSVDKTSFNEHEALNPRAYFPETWLWQLFSVNSSGLSNEQLILPDTITEWVARAVCVHLDKGLGLSGPSSITTFTPFFIDLTLPPSVKRGEILPVKISVFNYLDHDLPVKVTLEESPDFEILEGNEGRTRSSCISSREKVVHIVRIKPKALGDVNITVKAFVDETFSEECGPEYVISKRDILIKPIKVEIEGYPREKTWTKYICTKDINENADAIEEWMIEAPADIVPDSARGWVTAVGDLLGPTLENLGSLVRMPYGCGEQNMLNFAPNIFILQYLEASKQGNSEIVQKATEYMLKGYQRELNYRHKDGSFSAFGESDESGSTWLTAFVLKSFAQAKQFIQVDEGDLEMSKTWLSRQQLENGCFESVGKVFHKGMKGGIGGSGSPVPLASYVLISLLEAGVSSSVKSVSEAAFCLKADTSADPYTASLKAYALALAGAPEAEEAMSKLIVASTETSNSMHWELPSGIGQSEGVAVETAGYAILAMLQLDDQKYNNQARKIVKWISAQRNGQGGFVSTQDTVVALQALARFESFQDQGTPDLHVVVNAADLEKSFHIDESNKLLQQMEVLPTIPSNVLIDIEGQGCALIQAVLRYNLPNPDPSDAFNISVEATTEPDPKCVTKRIRTCASYRLKDGKSNMAVIEINLVSGYIPEKADLKQVVGYGSGLIKRYEVDGSKVTFYIDEFSSRDICISFRIIREVDVEDAKPGTVTVYDYYEPKFSVSKNYILPPNDDCLRNWWSPVEDDIIDLFIEEEEEVKVSTSTVNSKDIDNLLAALDDIP